MPPGFQYELVAKGDGFHCVAGVDEAGRGPLAGPVVAAAVIFVGEPPVEGIDDSKKLTEGTREELYEALVQSGAICWSIGLIDARVIDRINILQATRRAMELALRRLKPTPDLALVDGLPFRRFAFKHRAIVGGDGISLSIAAASIIAKVTRDRLMRRLHRRFKGYGFDTNKGYGTPAHLDALRRLGPCPIHRRTFSPMAQALLPGF